MGDFTIGVNIAGRLYKMTINPSNEEIVTKAANRINEKVNDFSKNYAFKDSQDLLAMVALQFTTELIQQKAPKDALSPQLVEQLKEIENLLKS